MESTLGRCFPNRPHPSTSLLSSLHTLGVRSNKQLFPTLLTCMQSSKIQNDPILGGNAQLFCRGLLRLWFPFQKVGADGHEALSPAVLHLPHRYLLSSSCLILPANQHLLHSEPLHIHLMTNTHHLSFPKSYFLSGPAVRTQISALFSGRKGQMEGISYAPEAPSQSRQTAVMDTALK